VRPFVKEFFTQVSSRFKIGIFTSSQREYADAIIDQILDPTGQLIKFRLYKENCTCTTDGIYIKDLRVIKSHPLDQILIVDSSVHSFGF
jgi:Dullard-like phosphatase family protein